jgi:hypothetical protein
VVGLAGLGALLSKDMEGMWIALVIFSVILGEVF